MYQQEQIVFQLLKKYHSYLNFSSIHNEFFVNKKFPGISDKRDRLPLIDYDQLQLNKDFDILKPYQTIKKPPKPKIILPNKMIYVHIKTLNEGQYFVNL